MIVLRAALEATQRHAEAILAVHKEGRQRYYVGNICECAGCGTYSAHPCVARTEAEAIRSTMLEQLAALDQDYATFRIVLEEIRDNEQYLAAHEMAQIAAAALERLVPDPGVVSNPDTQTEEPA